MATDRCVRWGKEALDLFSSAQDKSLTLTCTISYSCVSQTGEGFEELINSINSLENKIAKVVILDSSYLYRHNIPEFSKYIDSTIPTEWFLKNKKSIEKCKVETVVENFAEGLQTEKFKRWQKQINEDFESGKNGGGGRRRFRI